MIRVADYTTRTNYQKNYAKANREEINARKREWRKINRFMNKDQPKPTGEPECCWCGQEMSKHDMSHDPRVMPSQPLPKPTGEWTARKAATGYIAGLYWGNIEIYRQSLVALEDLERIADAHNATLAAEDEKAKAAWRRVVTLEQQLAAREAFSKRVEKQLATERERAEKLMDALGHRADQLAAAVKALKEIERDSNGWEKSMADAALPKIKL